MANKAAEEELAEISLEQQVRNVYRWFCCVDSFYKLCNFTKYTIFVHAEAGPWCHHYKMTFLWKQWLYKSSHFKVSLHHSWRTTKKKTVHWEQKSPVRMTAHSHWPWTVCGSFIVDSKKVPLRERKRHTDRRLSSTPSVVLFWGQGYPIADRGYPCQMGGGVPYPRHFRILWDGVPPPPVWTDWKHYLPPKPSDAGGKNRCRKRLQLMSMVCVRNTHPPHLLTS